MWTLIIALSAINGFAANTEGGVALLQVTGFTTQTACATAANKLLERNTKVTWMTVTCIEVK